MALSYDYKALYIAPFWNFFQFAALTYVLFVIFGFHIADENKVLHYTDECMANLNFLPQFVSTSAEVATMYNSYVNVARERALISYGRIDERVLAVYDANCASLRLLNGTDTDNCQAIHASSVCARSAKFTPSLATDRLQSLCSRRTDNTQPFFAFTNKEICLFVGEEKCTNATAVFDSGSFSNIFCNNISEPNSLLSTLTEKCLDIDAYDTCKEKEAIVMALQGAVIVVVMVLLGVMEVWYGRLEGDAGDVEIKRLFAKAALQQKPKWIAKWHAVYSASVGQPGTEADVMTTAFRSFEQVKLDHFQRTKYKLPMLINAELHRIPKIALWFAVFLELVLLTVLGLMISCGDAFEVRQLGSIVLFLIAFVVYLLPIVCFPRYQKKHSWFRQWILSIELVCDKSVQRALITGDLGVLTEGSLEDPSARLDDIAE